MFGFRDIDIIRAIVRHGGFRAASDATGLAQSAISRRVRHLESRMRITIFERDGRGVRLTAPGRRLLEEAEILIAQRDRILEELTQGDMAGVVRLGVAETMTHTILPRLLTDLRTRHPLLRFEISVDTSEQMAQMLIEDQLDVAILLRDQAPRGAHLAALPPVSLGWFAAPAHFALPRPAGIDDLAANPIVSFPKSTLPHRRVLDLLSPGRRRAVAVHGSASLATVLHLVGQGFGIGTIPHDIVRAWPHVGIEEIPTRADARLPDLDFAICFMPERNEDIGREVTNAALAAAE
ncbi:LysR family transcriptional regulator [Paracoccus sp. 1_MG-2023]|uniref:LysR family transcriptional regulator n=1 Tax=unclassified Paracoccus (in: a-proteobacteria) TaxID=2688777 RepID=UPI001C085959|nr:MULTISPECIES: LysR family transcriptional regulator [unclassified Paracoccus (in: a-proteobacteria)]MBU2957675.1 LysR family transcriptional regulator [Paracoccus sp. C2R09]MDO6667477.1 LysR family transcriptional regulator [Paracoccus sp. 1_MG-2023]